MQNLTYFAVLEQGLNGSYSIFFPDLPGCYSYADKLEDAAAMAEEAANLHIYGLQKDGELVPKPSEDIPKIDNNNMAVIAITVHPDVFRVKHENERVKTNTTIPLWLKQIAETYNVNYSRLLEAALIDYLKIKEPTALR